MTSGHKGRSAKDSPSPEQQVRLFAKSLPISGRPGRPRRWKERDMGVFNGMFPIQAGKE
jgi:hypothetical protein